MSTMCGSSTLNHSQTKYPPPISHTPARKKYNKLIKMFLRFMFNGKDKLEKEYIKILKRMVHKI